MDTFIHTLDVNAHITDVTCNVEFENQIVTARIDLFNCTAETITGIKFNAIGYNSFGDAIQINGTEHFSLNGKSGYLLLSLLDKSAFGAEQYCLFTAYTNDGQALSYELYQNLLTVIRNIP